MKRWRFSEQQIAFILQQAEAGVAVEEVCRKAGISIQTYYRWRKKYGGLMPSEMKRLKLLEEENARLKKLWRIFRSTKRCCRMSSKESYEACSGPAVGRSSADQLPDQHSACLWCGSVRSLQLSLSAPPSRAGQFA